MNVSTMESLQRGSEWRQRFANDLIRLQPDINPDVADEISDSEYSNGHHLEPELAARRFVAAASAAVPASDDRAVNQT